MTTIWSLSTEPESAAVTEPESAAVWVPIAAVSPWEDNPRINEAAIDWVAQSIKRFGFGAPILARKANGEIIAGHTRYAAAKKLNLSRVPVRYLDLDPAEAHVLALADNKLAEIADWDKDLLAAVLGEFQIHDHDLLTGTGFDQKEIDKLLEAGELEGGGEEPAEIVGLSYKVVIDCLDETQQAELLERLEAEGLKCQPQMS